MQGSLILAPAPAAGACRAVAQLAGPMLSLPQALGALQDILPSVIPAQAPHNTAGDRRPAPTLPHERLLFAMSKVVSERVQKHNARTCSARRAAQLPL